MRYLITVRIDGDPSRTQDVAIESDSTYRAGWLYRYLNPQAEVVAVRPAPEHRQ